MSTGAVIESPAWPTPTAAGGHLCWSPLMLGLALDPVKLGRVGARGRNRSFKFSGHRGRMDGDTVHHRVLAVYRGGGHYGEARRGIVGAGGKIDRDYTDCLRDAGDNRNGTPGGPTNEDHGHGE